MDEHLLLDASKVAVIALAPPTRGAGAIGLDGESMLRPAIGLPARSLRCRFTFW
jgi:hypothetical protein